MKFPEPYRVPEGFHPRFHSKPGDPVGCFEVPAHKAPKRRTLRIIATDGVATGWDHVSVSLGPGCSQPPTWAEMCFVKDLFWEEAECVVQFHPPKQDYVNFHAGTLHLWRHTGDFPMPPKTCV